MPAPKEEEMMPSDALAIKQVLESMVILISTPLVPLADFLGAGPLHQFTDSVIESKACGSNLQGIKEYETRVVHQLLDFMYRNVAEVLQVAEVNDCIELIHSSAQQHAFGPPLSQPTLSPLLGVAPTTLLRVQQSAEEFSHRHVAVSPVKHCHSQMQLPDKPNEQSSKPHEHDMLHNSSNAV